VSSAVSRQSRSPRSRPWPRGLDWLAGVALQHIVDAGIKAEDVLALVRQVRVRAITDAIAVIDQSPDWTICDLVDGAHEPLEGRLRAATEGRERLGGLHRCPIAVLA
jgi:hypothetical protein